MVANHDQYITVEVSSFAGVDQFICLAVYATCDVEERKALWQKLIDFGNSINRPWIVTGDFNVVADQQEKLGGNAIDFNVVLISLT